MCYSKEVQLTTVSIIVISTIFFYLRYSEQYKKTGKKWLLPFLTTSLIATALIGGHQLFEFLSLVTNNQIVYKTGLLISISAMLFYLFALEKLYNRNLHAKYFIIGLIGLALHMFSVPMGFQAHSFYLKHFSIALWGAYWLIMFFYFHICAFTQRKALDKNVSGTAVLLGFLAFADVSLILSAIYSFWGYSSWGLNFCTDIPSIWCTFSVVQVLTIPLLLSILPKALKSQPAETTLSKKTAFKYFLISLVMLGLFAVIPSCLTTKYVFP